MIKPKPLQPPVEGGFTIDDFTVDEQAGTVTCPAGQVAQLSRTRIATFGVACRDCPLRERCTTCKRWFSPAPESGCGLVALLAGRFTVEAG